MRRALLLAMALWGAVGCTGQPFEDGALDEQNADSNSQSDEVASVDQQLLPPDAPGPAVCKADCMDVCNADGQHFSACSSSCTKACHPPGLSGGGGGSSGGNPTCLTANKVWEAICKGTPVLQAACFFSGGCSGCRKKMDNGC